MNFGRSSGILLHVTSLPSRFGIGDLGPGSRWFIDFLAHTKQKLWCVLPLGPTGPDNSPYQSQSTFAGNPLLISPELLSEHGYISKKDLALPGNISQRHVNFGAVRKYKDQLLKKAFLEFTETRDYLKFESSNGWWLEPYSVFMSLREANKGLPWNRFDKRIRPSSETIRFHKFVQYEFARQWNELRGYCKKREISILGDLPFYAEHDSADVWNNPELFDLKTNGQSRTVGGVPPDYFSKDGQRWGTPTYQWKKMQKTGFKWWLDRFRMAFKRVDLLRLDHFRGFEAYWSVPANQKTARKGKWIQGPGKTLFTKVREELGDLPFVAENLGTITPKVEELRQQFGFPGMGVLQFAFDDDNVHRPCHYLPGMVCFTGTHDNDTTVGWWKALNKSARDKSGKDKVARVKSYFQTDGSEIHWSFIQAILTSVANTVAVPMQDVLGLGSEARMNMPGCAAGNWGWRLQEKQLTRAISERLRDLTVVSGR